MLTSNKKNAVWVAISLIALIACENKTARTKTGEISGNTLVQTLDRPRILPIEGAYNVRDLGGYIIAGNKRVKWDKVFRSGDLNQLTDADLAYFAFIPLRSYIDFRDSAEVATAPDRKPVTLEHYFALPIEAGNIIDMKTITAEQAPYLLVEANKSFVRDWQGVYKEFFALLMDESNTPLLFHCSAGKDRTGYAAALFLSALGVDRETVIQDYMLSAPYVEKKYATMVEKMPVLAPLMTVKREYIQAAFNVIDNEYGGIENYLTRYLGVDLVALRAMYTEDNL